MLYNSLVQGFINTNLTFYFFYVGTEAFEKDQESREDLGPKCG